jgi:Flp pilus assembly protein TadG
MSGTSRARSDRDAGAVRDRDAGMVTVETAIALGGFVAVVVMVLAGLASVLAQLQCTDAAREAARLVARGETQQARQIAARIAPSGAKIDIAVTADTVSVTIRADPVGGILPGVSLHAAAFAVREPESADQPTAPGGTPPTETTATAEGPTAPPTANPRPNPTSAGPSTAEPDVTQPTATDSAARPAITGGHR